MKLRPGIMGVVFRRTRKETRFLLLHRTQNWKGYEFVKGGIVDNETEWETVNRELREETGLKPIEIVKTPYKLKYKWSKEYTKDNKTYDGVNLSLFVIEVKGNKVKLDKSEHDNYKWVTKEKALKYLTYKDQKKAFKYALEHYF